MFGPDTLAGNDRSQRCHLKLKQKTASRLRVRSPVRGKRAVKLMVAHQLPLRT